MTVGRKWADKRETEEQIKGTIHHERNVGTIRNR